MKTRFCFVLICCLLLGIMVFPGVAADTVALTVSQPDAAEPGQDLTLLLSLPNTTLAGGFVELQYDASLFSFKSAQLLQATDTLTLTYDDQNGHINLLLDAAQNAHIDGALIALTFASSEEAQPGGYAVRCTVPDTASFYALKEDGSTAPLFVEGCQGQLMLTSPALPACPVRYLACQETNPKNDQFSVRLCALVDFDTVIDRGNYGFTCLINDANGTRELTVGGSEILDQIEGGSKRYTADALGGNIYTAVLNLPATGDVSIKVTPFVIMNDQILYAGTYTVLYQNGTYVGTSDTP